MSFNRNNCYFDKICLYILFLMIMSFEHYFYPVVMLLTRKSHCCCLFKPCRSFSVLLLCTFLPPGLCTRVYSAWMQIMRQGLGKRLQEELSIGVHSVFVSPSLPAVWWGDGSETPCFDSAFSCINFMAWGETPQPSEPISSSVRWKFKSRLVQCPAQCLACSRHLRN